MNSVALLVMADGRRQCIEATIRSARDNLIGLGPLRFIHDDSGDEGYGRWLREEFVDFEVHSTPGRSGFGGAIRSAWAMLLGCGYAHGSVLHLEDDFTFNRPVDLTRLDDVLHRHPHLAQLALRRQPWNADERRAGGIVEQHPDEYVERAWRGERWLEHRRFFTTNPCLYRRQLMTAGWPEGAESEGRFGLRLFTEGLPWGVPGAAVRSAFYGARDSGEWVHHIGHTRAGTGY